MGLPQSRVIKPIVSSQLNLNESNRGRGSNFMKLNCVFLSALLALLSSVAMAAPGDLDLTFGSGGKVLTSLGGTDDRGYCVTMQSDGKIVVAGHSDSDIAVARFTSTGSLDASFGSGGKVITS